ncbi:MAG: FAD-dependent oxidoreductase [Eubacteriales bacterium]|nr:FAD-dependent oxidoreductase [Eubacteriales bacterium]
MKIKDSGKKYDIIVCGCGSAGFCAAVQAARAGMKTAVLERHGMPGGIMTVYGNNDVAQFYAHHKQVIAGIGWEFILRLNEKGFAPIPDMSVDAPHPYYGIHVNIPAAAHMMDVMLAEAGVDILYNRSAVEVEVSEANGMKHVDDVIISTKDGLARLSAKMFIDASGDGDLSAWAGARYECGDTLQPGTIRYYFKIEGLDEDTAREIDAAMTRAAGENRLLKSDYMGAGINRLIGCDGNNINHISNFNGADSDSKTAADIEGRAAVNRIMESMGRHGNLISNIAPETALRETRRIICDHYITCEEYVSAHYYPDSICNSFYPIDLHREGMQGIYQIFLKDGQVPMIPLSALTVADIDNLYVAGRCASGDRLANSAYRVKASCMAMGQAAAAAAAVAVKQNNGISRGCDLDAIKSLLREHGAIVP